MCGDAMMDNLGGDYLDDDDISRVQLPIDNDRSGPDASAFAAASIVHINSDVPANGNCDAQTPQFTRMEYRDDMDTPLLFDVSELTLIIIFR